MLLLKLYDIGKFACYWVVS